jgi:DNA-binding NtrC family response regulator
VVNDWSNREPFPSTGAHRVVAGGTGASALVARLRALGVEASVLSAETPAEPDVVLVSAFDRSQLAARCAELRLRLPRAGIIAVGSGKSPIAEARASLQARADDFLPSLDDATELRNAIARATNKRRLRHLLTALDRDQDQSVATTGFLGNSPPMARLKKELSRLLEATCHVTFVGERGAGKLTLAHALHCHGATRGGPLSIVRCRRLAPASAEATLWGYLDTTGRVRPGLLAAAAGGALLLQQVSALPLALQRKLAVDLERRRMRPLGASVEQRLDTRVLATTTSPLGELVEAGALRPELHQLLGQRQLRVPALRDRGSDILVMAHRFVLGAAARSGKPVHGLTPAAAARLLAYDWPGNITELAACMSAAVTASTHDHVFEEDLAAHVGAPRAEERSVDLRPWDDVEREHIFRVLDEVDGNKSEAARLLGISRKTLYRKLDAFVPGSVPGPSQSGVHRVGEAVVLQTRPVTNPARSA